MAATCFTPHVSALQPACSSHQAAPRAVPAAPCRHQHAARRHSHWSQSSTDLHSRASLRCSAEPTDSIEPTDPPLPSTEDSDAAPAQLGPRDDDVSSGWRATIMKCYTHQHEKWLTWQMACGLS